MTTQMTAEQYWKWRASIAEMWVAESKEKAAKHELMTLQLKSQLAQTESQLFFYRYVAKLTEEYQRAKSSYNDLKAELEKELLTSLSGVVVDDVTFEIKKLEE
jgi:hypothetical protein